MAFLPALPTAPTAAKRPKKDKPSENAKKSYRISLSNVNKTTNENSTSAPPLIEKRYQKRENQADNDTQIEQSIICFGTCHQQKLFGQQNDTKSKNQMKLPVIKCCDPAISEKSMIWMEPLGLWIPPKKGRRFYEKFSSRMDLLCKDPDYLLDPCPHIPRCDHSRSWSAVKLERQKFRELSQLRNEQLFQRTLERYRGMQGIWLQQLNNRRDVLHSTSSQARLENFRRFAGECFDPLSEMQRLERLEKRRREWEETWRAEAERRKENMSKKDEGCRFPRIIVTKYDDDLDVTNTMDISAYESCDEIRKITTGRDDVSFDQHASVHHTRAKCTECDYLQDKYDIVCTPINCCSELDDNLYMAEEDHNDFVTEVNFVNKPENDLEREESVAQIRTTPGRICETQRRLKVTVKIPGDCTKSVKNCETVKLSNQNSSYNDRGFNPMKSEDSIETDPISSSKSEIKDPSSLTSLSLPDVGLHSSSIDELTEMSRSNLSLVATLLGNSIRQADNTVGLMGHLVPVPLGMASGKIPNRNITASSALDVYHLGNQARLHNEKIDSNGGAWIPRLHDANPYLEIDLGDMFTIQQVATQGNPASAVKQKRQKRWVTKYSLAFSEDGKEWNEYKESGCVKIFNGNTDSDTVVQNSLDTPVETRFIRFVPKEWQNGIAMRVEVFGPRPISEMDEVVEEIKSPQMEFRSESSDKFSESEDPKTELEQLFSTIDGNSENEKFDVIEGRIMTPTILHSPVPLLLSPRVAHVEQKQFLESKFCVNSITIPRVKNRISHVTSETCDEDQAKPSINGGEEQPSLADQNEPNIPQQDVDGEQHMSDTSTVNQVQNISSNPPLDPAEQRLRQLQRARRDGNIQEQLRREKMAEERRRKLALLNSRQTRQWSEKASEGIDEIYDIGSFLEKYCIIGKPDRIVYKRVFEKFDEDNDGFLWPEEILEALENVNKSLLIDSHLNYVFRILEQCDCHAESGTSFRLFSIIAALSQKVAALNDKMKLLISTCDFKTVDCTLLRAKLLFECYVDEHTKKISRTDFWIGLAAGGLGHANETVEEYFENRQSFDFLDFLTYLPLFQIIHGNVVENPLTSF